MVEKINAFLNKLLTKLHLVKFKEQVLYIIVGGMTTVIDWGVFALLKMLIPPMEGYFFLFRLSPYIIQYTFSWIAAVVFAYWASKYFVFEYGSGDNERQFVEFVLSRLLTLGISILFDVIFSGEKVGLQWNPYLVKMISSIVVVIINYVTNKWIVFNKKRKKIKPSDNSVSSEGEQK